MGEPVGPDRVQARGGQQDRQVIGRRRVTTVRRREILPDRRDDVHHPVQRVLRHGGRRQSAYSAYSGVERQRSPKDGTTTTMVFPAYSSREPTRTPASLAAPAGMPTGSPS